MYTTRPYSGVLLYPGPEHSACTQPARNHRVPPSLRESREELQAGLATLEVGGRVVYAVEGAVLLRSGEKRGARDTAVRELEGRGKAE